MGTNLKKEDYLIMLIFLLTLCSLPRILWARERAGRDTSCTQETSLRIKIDLYSSIVTRCSFKRKMTVCNSFLPIAVQHLSYLS
jgi:hypothetical protein